MQKKHIVLLSIFFLSYSLSCLAASQKLTCQITATKSALWHHYDVTITMKTLTDIGSGDVILKIDLPASNNKTLMQVSKTFDCNKYYQFNFSAIYTPAIWHNKSGKPIENTFTTFQLYNIANQINTPIAGNDEKATLTVPIRFPEDFSAPTDPSLAISAPSNSPSSE